MKKVVRTLATAVLVSGLLLGQFVPGFAKRLLGQNDRAACLQVAAIKVDPLGWAGGRSST